VSTACGGSEGAGSRRFCRGICAGSAFGSGSDAAAHHHPHTLREPRQELDTLIRGSLSVHFLLFSIMDQHRETAVNFNKTSPGEIVSQHLRKGAAILGWTQNAPRTSRASMGARYIWGRLQTRHRSLGGRPKPSPRKTCNALKTLDLKYTFFLSSWEWM